MEELEESLSALVDGLSGALCVILLVSVVFMVSTSSKIENEMSSLIYNDDYYIDFNERKAVFFKPINKLDLKTTEEWKKSLQRKKINLFVNNKKALKNGIIEYGKISYLFEGLNSVKIKPECPKKALICLTW